MGRGNEGRQKREEREGRQKEGSLLYEKKMVPRPLA